MAATSPEVLADQDRERRGSRQREYIAALTGLRGFAAMVVLVGHCAGVSAHPWIGLPSYGPIALFVLSGFLLFQPWSSWFVGVGPRPGIAEFARRRAWRIFPPYLLLVAVIWVVLPVSRPVTGEMAVRTVTLTHIYVPFGLSTGLGHTWSLGTELSWYVVLPITGLLIGLALRHSRVSANAMVAVVVLVMLALTIAWRLHVSRADAGAPANFPMLFPMFAVCFFGGAAVGHLKVLQNNGLGGSLILRALSRSGLVTLLLALTIGALGASRLGGPWGFERSTLAELSFRAGAMTLTALLLIAGVAASGPGSIFTSIFGNRLSVAIGRWSYGIYLWHFPVLILLLREFSARPANAVQLAALVAVTTAISVPLGAATYRFVEQPAIAFSKRGRAR